MYELIHAAERTYYIDCPAKMGLYLENATDVWLIDSGNDKEAGKKIQKILTAQGWNLKAIINTHSNADHIGGNHLLQDRLGCPIYAKGIDAAFTRFPILEPSFLYGGYPCKALRNKFLMAQDSQVLELSTAPLPPGMEIIDLPGHYFHMIGVKTPDNVWFLADCLTSEAIIDKYHISFIYDVAAYLDTLDRIEQLEGASFIPSHAEAVPDIRPLARANRQKVLEIKEKLLACCGEPLTFEEILKRVFDDYGLTMDVNQYVLVGSTIRSYLSWLCDLGQLSVSFEDNRMLWKQRAAK